MTFKALLVLTILLSLPKEVGGDMCGDCVGLNMEFVITKVKSILCVKEEEKEGYEVLFSATSEQKCDLLRPLMQMLFGIHGPKTEMELVVDSVEKNEGNAPKWNFTQEYYDEATEKLSETIETTRMAYLDQMSIPTEEQFLPQDYGENVQSSQEDFTIGVNDEAMEIESGIVETVAPFTDVGEIPIPTEEIFVPQDYGENVQSSHEDFTRGVNDEATEKESGIVETVAPFIDVGEIPIPTEETFVPQDYGENVPSSQDDFTRGVNDEAMEKESNVSGGRNASITEVMNNRLSKVVDRIQKNIKRMQIIYSRMVRRLTFKLKREG